MVNEMIEFTKMHGAGNDYIYVNTMKYDIPDPSATAIAWSRPHFGIGSDGLILIGRASTPDADFSMRIFNNDGSEAMMCGNGTRCVAKYLHDKGLTDKNPIRLETLSGIKILTLHLDKEGRVETVTVDMGAPILEDENLFDPVLGKNLSTPLPCREGQGGGSSIFVSMGNPHFVIFTDEDVEKLPIEVYGPQLEHHPAFPQRCNIEFAQLRADGTVRMRVWERGSGITLACGTGACATAVAAAITGRTGRRCTIEMDGGVLQIEWDEQTNHVMKTGPAAFVFEGTINLSDK
ncbi:MAG: diaminopimelate epimerase [Bacteroidaceae bacterium]|nr:diaminopimelate epimerase [Bacteroidaceae bacterium]